MSREDYFISLFKSRNIGDDGAFVDGYIYSKDAFYENVHFKRSWLSLKEIAIKSFLVNISDSIVMNASAKYALLSVAIAPDMTKRDLKELYSGFEEVCARYGIEIIGGDTIANSKLDITVTLISKVEKPSFRSGLKESHLLAYTGSLGSVKRDLNYLLRGFKVSKKSKFITPTLKESFFRKIAPFVSTSIDISDGLYKELERLSKANKLGFKLFKKFSKLQRCSGEEYEILFSFDKKYRKKIENIARRERVKIDIFARAKRASFKNFCKANHF
jgi:thiamine-monophosphate kinase